MAQNKTKLEEDEQDEQTPIAPADPSGDPPSDPPPDDPPEGPPSGGQ